MAAPKNDELVIEIVSDFVCPWCYIGDTRMEKAIRDAAPNTNIKLRWLPYELNAAMPEQGMDRKQYLSQKFGGPEKLKEIETRMTNVAAEDGLEFRQDLINISPNTRKAHRLAWLAAKEDKAPQLARKIFEAYFTKGLDIGDIETLSAIAAETGMDKNKVKAFLNSTEGAIEIQQLEDQNAARGIRMVPHITIGDEEMSGAYPAEDMAALIKRALKARQAA